MDIDNLKITVTKEADKIYKITYSGFNKYTQRQNEKKFNFNTYTKEISEEIIKYYFKKIILTMNTRQLFGIKDREQPTFTPKKLKSLLHLIIRNEYRSKGGKIKVSEMLNDNEINEDEELNKDINILPNTSILNPLEVGGGQTHIIFGKSFSGKSTFLVNNINKLKRDDYFKIIIFTESINCEPFKKLNYERLPILLFDRFIPKIVEFLKNINDNTKNRYRFLIIFDDILNVRNNLINKMFCIFRNSNISTVVLTQYTKLITPASRNNCHHIYITNLKPNEFGWGSILPTLGITSSLSKKFKTNNKLLLYEKIAEFMGKNKILYYNGKNEEFKFFLR